MGAGTPHQCRVLVIEDDQAILQMLALVLEAAGYVPQLAANGAEGLSVLDAATALPRLILLDLQMPVIDGRAFLQHQRAHPQWNAIPVILMTAAHQSAASRHELAVDATISKPFEPDALLDLLARWCQ